MMQLFSIWAITKVWGNNLFLNFKLRGHSPKTDMSLPLADFNLILVAIKFSSLFGSISSNKLGLIIVTLDPVSTNMVISLFFISPLMKIPSFLCFTSPTIKIWGEGHGFVKQRLFRTLSVSFGILDPSDTGSPLSI